MRRGRIALVVGSLGAATLGAFYLGFHTFAHETAYVTEPGPVQKPSVYLDPPEKDFGPQLWGIEIPFEVLLVNDGSEPVTIDGTSTSCACAVVADKHEGRTVQPGEMVAFSLTLETRFTVRSKVEELSVSLSTGETLTSRLLVDVTPTYRVEPDSVDFGDLSMVEEGSATRIATFTSDHGRKVVGMPRANVDWIETALARRDGKTEILVRALKGRLPPGRSTGNLVITTDDPARPEVSIYVTAQGIQELLPDPAHVFLVGSETQRVRVLDAGRRPVEIISATSDYAAIRVVISQGGAIEVTNTGGKAMLETVTVRIEDDRARAGRFLVSTFR